jgi:6-phosphogluconolactonase
MIRVFNDYETLSQAAASALVELAAQAINSSGRFSIALSGGETPRRLYEILATAPLRDQIDWGDVHVFWGDERCVPTNDPRSNYLMARQTLLDHVPVPENQIHPIYTDMPAHLAAFDYETDLRNFFDGRPPIFDLVLLGLGENAHTASLFPHSPVLDESERWVKGIYIAEQGMFRVTLTPRVINQAKEVIFLVSGGDKAEALQEVLEGAYQPHEWPAQLIHPSGAHPTWMVDKAATHKLVAEAMESA